MSKNLFARAQANFWAGLVVVLPGVISIALLVWLFGTATNITDTLLIFLPRRITHEDNGAGPMYWYWSLVALGIAVLLVGVMGLLARNYFGKRLIEWVETALLQVPLLNKIYGAIKQVNDALSTGKKTAFRTVVLVEFPSAGMYSIGFVTNDNPPRLQGKDGERLVCVFVPTTPNPTTGFLVLVPGEKVTKLDISVADGIKYIISLGSFTPEAAAVDRPNGDVPAASLTLRA